MPKKRKGRKRKEKEKWKVLFFWRGRCELCGLGGVRRSLLWRLEKKRWGPIDKKGKEGILSRGRVYRNGGG